MNLDVSVTVRVDARTAAEMLKIANAEQRTLANVARRLISLGLATQQKTKEK